MAEITREQLAEALDGMEIVVDIINAPILGQWMDAKPRYPGKLASEILARIAEQDGRQESRDELTTAFSRCYVDITEGNSTASFSGGYPTEESAAKLAAVAEREFAGRQHEDVTDTRICREHAGTDPEMAAIARILAELDGLAGESGAGEPSSARVLTYIASRYGYVLTDAQ